MQNFDKNERNSAINILFSNTDRCGRIYRIIAVWGCIRHMKGDNMYGDQRIRGLWARKVHYKYHAGYGSTGAFKGLPLSEGCDSDVRKGYGSGEQCDEAFVSHDSNSEPRIRRWNEQSETPSKYHGQGGTLILLKNCLATHSNQARQGLQTAST